MVSLVPSLTEAIVATRAHALVGATDWCTHPADLAVTRVRGTKNPDVRAIADRAHAVGATVVVVEVGLITPPVGMNVFVINGMARDVPMWESFKGVMPLERKSVV